MPGSWEHAVAAVPVGHAIRRSLDGRRGRPAGTSFWIDASSVSVAVAALPVSGRVGSALIRFCDEMAAFRANAIRVQLDDYVVELIAHDGERLRVRIEREPPECWMTIEQMAKVFGKDPSLVSRALARALSDGRLDRTSCSRSCPIDRGYGGSRHVDHFNLQAMKIVAAIVRSDRSRAFLAFHVAASEPSVFRASWHPTPAVYRLSDYGRIK